MNPSFLQTSTGTGEKTKSKSGSVQRFGLDIFLSRSCNCTAKYSVLPENIQRLCVSFTNIFHLNCTAFWYKCGFVPLFVWRVLFFLLFHPLPNIPFLSGFCFIVPIISIKMHGHRYSPWERCPMGFQNSVRARLWMEAQTVSTWLLTGRTLSSALDLSQPSRLSLQTVNLPGTKMANLLTQMQSIWSQKTFFSNFAITAQMCSVSSVYCFL